MSEFLASNLKFYRKKRGKTQEETALALGLSRSTYANYEVGGNEPSIGTIIEISKFLDISTDDLLLRDAASVQLNERASGNLKGQNVQPNVQPSVQLTVKKGGGQPGDTTGKNPVFSGTAPKVVTIDLTGEENAVFVPVKARAGYLVGYGDPEFIRHLEGFKIIGTRHRTYRIFEIEGNSMFNTFADRDRVNAYWVSISDIRDDRVYVLVTKNDGILIKRCINRYQDGKVICTSDNNHRGEYPPIIVDVYDIAEVWYVEERSTRQLGRPGEIYKRMVDMEAEVILMRQELNRISVLLPKNST